VLRVISLVLLALVGLGALYLYGVFNWSYSTGERAGWVQKFSHKGWLCKTWEGELSMVSMPGAAQEKFYFTVRDDATADAINKAMGQRVTMHYAQRIGLPTSCFGETEYWVDHVAVLPEVPLAPGVAVPAPAPAPAQTPVPAPAPPAAATPK
jgi:hypothetical protein